MHCDKRAILATLTILAFSCDMPQQPHPAAGIAKAWRENKAVREVMVFLQSHGASGALAQRIHKRYGDDAVNVVARDPYRLALDVWGVGFKTADRIAQELGITRDAPARIQAGLLQALLGKLNPRAEKETGRLVQFDQSPYGNDDVSMDATGFAYVPQRCLKERCRIHIAFHGCRQGAADVGEEFVRHAGYNAWADTNNLIVLYPQVIKRFSPFTWNPRGCWDWWGYTGLDYHTQSGAQIRAVKGMVDRLAGG